MKNPQLFEFENKYDHFIDKYINKYSKGQKSNPVCKIHVKGVMGVRGLLEDKELDEATIDKIVNKFVELLKKYKTFVRVYANWDGEVQKENGRYPNQEQINKTIAIVNFYNFRDHDCDDERAGVERDRIFKIRQRQADKEYGLGASIVALATFFLILYGIARLKGA